MQTHSSNTKFNLYRKTKHTKHKILKQPETVRTVNVHKCAYVKVMTILIIFPVILQTVINLIMLSIGDRGQSLNSASREKST